MYFIKNLLIMSKHNFLLFLLSNGIKYLNFNLVVYGDMNKCHC